MDTVTALVDRVASLVPGVIPARSAAAVSCIEYCSGSSCNNGEPYFVSFRKRDCFYGTAFSSRIVGCC